MRKLLFIIMFVLAAGIAAQAGNVTKQAAARKATAFLNLKSESQLQLLDCGYETMYLFAIQDGGFVVVSADNRVQPILAYSRLSGINPQRMPKNLKGWLDSYDKQKVGRGVRLDRGTAAVHRLGPRGALQQPLPLR